MKHDDILFSIAKTARKLGGISRNLVIQEIEEGKLKACWRGKRRFCTQSYINEYKQNQIIDKSVSVGTYKPKYLKRVTL